MSTAIAGKKLSTKRAEWDVRQRARQLKAHPDCRSTTIKLTRHENIPCVIVGPRKSSSRRDPPNGQTRGRCVPVQIDALQGHRDWDADALCDIVPGYVIEYLADDDAVLVIDGRGFLKHRM